MAVGSRRVVLRVALIVGAALAAARLAWPPLPRATPLDLALEAERLGRHAQALRWANEALDESPGHAEARAVRERALARIGRVGPGSGPPPDDLKHAFIEESRRHLASGQPGPARLELEPLLAEQADPEASWLLSRALLQLGDAPGARSALEAAGDFARADPTRPEPAVHVGSTRCVECHAEIVAAQHASRHARTLRNGASLTDVPLPEGDQTDPGNPEVRHAFHREGAEPTIESSVGGATFAAWIEFAVGSGDRGMSFIGRDKQDQPRLVRVSTFDHHRLVDVTPMAPPEVREPSEYLGMRIADSLADCLGCHSTKVERHPTRAGLVSTDRGITCERCHGPAGNHLKAVELGFPDPAIARPRLATAEQVRNLCAQCHQPPRGRIPPDDDPTLARQQSLTMARSRCYTESRGRFGCLSCHDPHRDASTSAEFYEARCTSCHAAEAPPVPPIEVVRAAVCPVDDREGCVDCHMPRVENPSEHSWFTDHHIRIPRRADATIGE